MDLAGLITEVRQALPVPITGVVSDGQESIRNAVAGALSTTPSLAMILTLRAAPDGLSLLLT